MSSYVAASSPPSPLLLEVPAPLLGEELASKSVISLEEITRFFFKRAYPSPAEMRAVAALFTSPWVLKSKNGVVQVSVASALKLRSAPMPVDWAQRHFMDKKLFFQRRRNLCIHLLHLHREELLNNLVYFAKKHQEKAMKEQKLRKSEEAFLNLLEVHTLSPFVGVLKTPYHNQMRLKLWCVEMKEKLAPRLEELKAQAFNSFYDVKLAYNDLRRASPCICFKQRMRDAGLCNELIDKIVA